MKIHDYTTPINKLTSISINQKHCESDHLIDINGLREILKKLTKEREKIKDQIGLKSRKQFKNLTDRFNKNKKCSMGYNGNRDLLLKFKSIGDQIHKIESEISKTKKICKGE